MHSVFLPLLTSIVLAANSPPSLTERLIEIQLEIQSLQQQLVKLEQKVESDHHKEMRHEIQSQTKMRSYAWQSFVHQLKAAEAHEENAKKEEKVIQAIKERLLILAQQLHTLLPAE